MTDSRDAEVPQAGEPVSGFSSADRIGLTLVGIGAAAVLVGVIKAILGGGDEPPIRVKGGSIRIRLLTTKKKWAKQKGDPKHWTVPHCGRKKDELEVVLALHGVPDNPHKGADLRIIHSDRTELQFISQGKHIQMNRIDDDGRPDLEQDPSDSRLVNYNPDGHITRVVLDTQEIWPKNSGTTLCEVLIYDS
jgi:hypothetical protein